jgi:hypothetical protein
MGIVFFFILLLAAGAGALATVALTAAPVHHAEEQAARVILELRRAEAGLNGLMRAHMDSENVIDWPASGAMRDALIPAYMFAPSLPPVLGHLTWSYGLTPHGGRDSAYVCLSGFTAQDVRLRALLAKRLSGVFEGAKRYTAGATCGLEITDPDPAALSAITVWRMEPAAGGAENGWYDLSSYVASSPHPGLAAFTPFDSALQPAMHACFTNPLGSTCTVNGVELYIASGSGSTYHPNTRVFLAMSDEPDAVPFYDHLDARQDYPVSGFHTVFQAWDPAFFSAADTWSATDWRNLMTRTLVGSPFAAGGTPMSWWQSQALVSALAADNRHPALAACARKSTGGLGWYLPEEHDLDALRRAGPGIDSIPNLKPGNVYRSYGVTSSSVDTVAVTTYSNRYINRGTTNAYMLGEVSSNANLGDVLRPITAQYVRCAAALTPF